MNIIYSVFSFYAICIFSTMGTEAESSEGESGLHFGQRPTLTGSPGQNESNPQESSSGSKRTLPFFPTCPISLTCNFNTNFYRTFDGTCNNPFNKFLGSAGSVLHRRLQNRYADGRSSPRISVTGAQLPSARLVTNTVVQNINRPSSEFTLSFMQWGQFIAHDITLTPFKTFENGSIINCCTQDGQFLPPGQADPECLPIALPVNDHFFSPRNRVCMNFPRSVPFDSSAFIREQMNRITHFIDGSVVYGSSEEKSNTLRSFIGGKLKTQPGNLLPALADCMISGTNLNCFDAGDARLNQLPPLTVFQTIMMREHNRVAEELAFFNPSWSDETLFQEARRIVVAEMQHITYNEWLPSVIGTSAAFEANLLHNNGLHIWSYSSSNDPSIINEFATIAYRFGHSLVQGTLKVFETPGGVFSTSIRNHFFNSTILYEASKFQGLLKGVCRQPMQEFDRKFAHEISNRVYQVRPNDFGIDLVAVNIQRGRDHGLPTYNDIRVACGLPRAFRFEDLSDTLPASVISAFKTLYASVDDIDAYIAGVSEFPYNGGIVGRTFNCIIQDQFWGLKFGDRFFYENGGCPSSFTSKQLQEISKATWARLVCDNMNPTNTFSVQPHAFRKPSNLNRRVSCSSVKIPKLSLNAWTSPLKHL